jgi:hypothetical protein
LNIEYEQIDEHVIDCKEQFMGCLIDYKPKYVDYYKKEVIKNKKLTKQEKEEQEKEAENFNFSFNFSYEFRKNQEVIRK